MNEVENDVALRLACAAADQLALRMCVVQMLADRMREQKNPETALRTFNDEVRGLLTAYTTGERTKGSVVQILAVERLGKLMETVRLALIE
jgi:hypothetical protein